MKRAEFNENTKHIQVLDKFNQKLELETNSLIASYWCVTTDMSEYFRLFVLLGVFCVCVGSRPVLVAVSGF